MILFNNLFSQNQIVILGKTNINSFKCINDDFKGTINTDANRLPVLSLFVNNFDCRHRTMTSDFRKTLNAESFPRMEIKFLRFSKISQNQYNGLMEVKIMNKSNIYDATFTSNGNFLSANRKVKFSDFGITPPRKMGGTIVVRDDLDLSLNLAVR